MNHVHLTCENKTDYQVFFSLYNIHPQKSKTGTIAGIEARCRFFLSIDLDLRLPMQGSTIIGFAIFWLEAAFPVNQSYYEAVADYRGRLLRSFLD